MGPKKIREMVPLVLEIWDNDPNILKSCRLAVTLSRDAYKMSIVGENLAIKWSNL